MLRCIKVIDSEIWEWGNHPQMSEESSAHVWVGNTEVPQREQCRLWLEVLICLRKGNEVLSSKT